MAGVLKTAMHLCAHDQYEHARFHMYIMPVALAWRVACRCHSIEQYAFHANRSMCYTCWCVCTYVWECMWVLPTVFAFTTVLLRQMLLCDFLAHSPALISTHTCSPSSDHSSLPVAGCLPIRKLKLLIVSWGSGCLCQP